MKLKLCVALLTVATVITPLFSFAQVAKNPAEAKRNAVAAYGKLPLSFEPTESSARFIAHSGAYTVAVGARESSVAVGDAKSKSGKGQTLRFAFANSNPSAPLNAIEPQPGITNYYIGQDSSKWRIGVKNYAKVRAQNVYPGVDVVYYGDHQRLEFDFVVAPNASPSAIAMSFSGAEKLYTDESGDLIAEVGGKPVRFAKPFAYQKVAGVSKPVKVSYEKTDSAIVRLRLGNYDPNSELVIDPVVSYIDYLGGSQGDTATGIAIDSSGDAYVTGQTCSSDFPGSPTQLGNCLAYDGYVIKFNPDASSYVYTTIIGGTNDKASVLSNAIALDSANQAYIAGSTNFNDLPGIASGYLNTLNSWRGGDSDAFITILAADGSLLRTSYLGGSGADAAYGIAVDSSNNVAVVGQTCSDDFPGYNAFETKVEFCVAFLTKLNNNLDIAVPQGYGASALTPVSTSGTPAYFFSEFYAGQTVPPYATAVWSSYTTYAAGAIIVDVNGNVQITYDGGESGKTEPTATLWSATKGGTTLDGNVTWTNLGAYAIPVSASTVAYGVALDPLGDVFVAGGTNSSSLSPYSYYAGSGSWVLKVAGTTSTAGELAGYFVYGTALETTASDKSSTTDTARAIAVDTQGRAYVTGTASGTLYSTSKSYSPAAVGGTDAFVVRMNTAGSAVEYATYLGGTGNDEGLGIAVDGSGAAYVTGSTTSSNFPTLTPLTNPSTGADLDTLSGTKDAFITKLSADGSAISFSTYLGGLDIDQGNAIVVDTSKGDMYVAGTTYSSNLDQLNPTNYVGTDTVYMGNGDGFLTKVAAATPVVSASPTSLVFSSEQLNVASSALAVTVTNTGTAALTIGSVAISGTDASDFSQTNTCTSVAVGLTCAVSIVFTPTAAGTRTATLTITDDASNSPQAVSLSGTAISGTGTISLSPTTLAFGSQTIGSSTNLTVTLANSASSGALAISGIALTGDSDFTASSSACSTSLAVGANCTITITFLPTSAAAKTAVLTVTGAGTNSPQTVSISGTGTSVSSTSGDYTVTPDSTGVSVIQGNTAVFTLSVSPENGFADGIGFTCSGPSGSYCTLSPTTLTMDGTTVHTVKLSVYTTGGNGVTAKSIAPRFGRGGAFLALLPFSMMGILLINRRRGIWLLLLLMGISLVMGLVGCSSGSGSSSGSGLAAGSYQVTLTGKSTGTTAVTHALTLNLTVSKQ